MKYNQCLDEPEIKLSLWTRARWGDRGIGELLDVWQRGMGERASPVTMQERRGEVGGG